MSTDENEETSGSGNALALGVALGIPFGGVIGLLFLDNFALGVAFGLLAGIAGALIYSRKKKA